MSSPPTDLLASRHTGLRFEFSNGALRRIDCGDVTLNLFIGNALEGGLANLYLRRLGTEAESVGPRPRSTASAPRGGEQLSSERPGDSCTPLLGPRSATRCALDAAHDALEGSGRWGELAYRVTLRLARDAAAWFWHVSVENTGARPVRVDLIHAQDIGLAPYGALRLNEYYVSQYVDHTPLQHPARGVLVASRQNQPAGGRHPWCVIGSLRHGASFATDARQVFGLAARGGAAALRDVDGRARGLPGHRLQHEHSMVAIQDAPCELAPGQRAQLGFCGAFEAHHAAASSLADLAFVDRVLALAEAAPPAWPLDADALAPAAASLFSSAPLLRTLELDEPALRRAYAAAWRHEERDAEGRCLSFFTDEQRHVVLRAKERATLRPHGHLLRSGAHVTPDETALTSTCWMGGVFHSMLTQGHVSINRFLSTVHGYLGLLRAHGQRVFAQIDGAWQLLDEPSAFEMAPHACRWIYHHGAGVLEVQASAGAEPREMALALQVREGPALRFLVSHHIALGGDDGSVPGSARWSRDGDDVLISTIEHTDLGCRFPDGHLRITPSAGTVFERVGGDELLFADGVSRAEPYLCIVTAPAQRIGFTLRGELVQQSADVPAQAPAAPWLTAPSRWVPPASAGTHGTRLLQLADIVPWYEHNALVHHLAPRGLEQYSGGGWGTRDVCQGPVELQLAFGRMAPVRDLLLRVMRAQASDGDWPQWFMFFERDRTIRAGDSHGDIVFWPLLALAQYLLASDDAALLDERVPFFDAPEPCTVWQHAERALELIGRRVVGGTVLAAYGHGDWNDALQPADPTMREQMCSAWTVTLHHQVLSTLAQAMRRLQRNGLALRFEAQALEVKRAFQQVLLIDGVLTGYALFEHGKVAQLLLHPRDTTTGVRYSVLAMIHAILEDLLTPAQTEAHLRLIREHLHGPDGVRLFDRPMPYHGGPMHYFQRAESASFFGREIGLMYMHAHLRYAQALAHIGDAQGFFDALGRANPIGIRGIVPTAALRQANCYYSSSDAAFDDRAQAAHEYARIGQGTVALEGGWRVYSSGAGIALGLLIRQGLGLSCEAHALLLDPVLPPALNGLRVDLTLWGQPVEVTYRVRGSGCGVNAVHLGNETLAFERAPNPHRLGAVRIAKAALLGRRSGQAARLQIDIGR